MWSHQEHRAVRSRDRSHFRSPPFTACRRTEQQHGAVVISKPLRRLCLCTAVLLSAFEWCFRCSSTGGGCCVLLCRLRLTTERSGPRVFSQHQLQRTVQPVPWLGGLSATQRRRQCGRHAVPLACFCPQASPPRRVAFVPASATAHSAYSAHSPTRRAAAWGLGESETTIYCNSLGDPM